ncbi:flagellar biosynthesis repressor FlbT [Mesorhizobium atlanticum]
MTNTLKISLKPNEKIYINGAVIRVDRKVTIELMNDVQFLLESHVIQADQASTPLRQLYFVVQIMLINPRWRRGGARHVPPLAADADRELRQPWDICNSLKQIDRMVGEDEIYEALKAIRALYPLERKALEDNDDIPEEPRALAVGA